MTETTIKSISHIHSIIASSNSPDLLPWFCFYDTQLLLRIVLNLRNTITLYNCLYTMHILHLRITINLIFELRGHSQVSCRTSLNSLPIVRISKTMWFILHLLKCCITTLFFNSDISLRHLICSTSIHYLSIYLLRITHRPPIRILYLLIQRSLGFLLILQLCKFSVLICYVNVMFHVLIL